MSRKLRLVLSAIISFVLMFLVLLIFDHTILDALVESFIACVTSQVAVYFLVHKHKI